MKITSTFKILMMSALVLSIGSIFGMECSRDKNEDLQLMVFLPCDILKEIGSYLSLKKHAQYLIIIASSSRFSKNSELAKFRVSVITKILPELKKKYLGFKLLDKIDELKKKYEEGLIDQIEQEAAVALIRSGADVTVRPTLMRLRRSNLSDLAIIMKCSELDITTEKIKNSFNSIQYFEGSNALCALLELSCLIYDETNNANENAAQAQKAIKNIIASLIEVTDFDLNGNERDEDGNTPLILATQANDIETVSLLLKKSVDINAKNNCKKTAMWEAASHGYKDIVELLLEQGAEVDGKSLDEETTPLMEAAVYEHIEIVQMLIDASADPTHQNYGGLTARDMALEVGQKEIAQILAQYEQRWAKEQAEQPAKKKQRAEK